MLTRLNRIVLCAVLTCVWASFANAITLVTPSYEIKIDSLCEEGNVTCDNVAYKGIRKSDGASLTLTGRTLNRKNSFSLYGYEFKNGDYFYYVMNNAEFFIQKDGKTISSEQGYWQQDEPEFTESNSNSGYPQDVVQFIEKREQCDHFREEISGEPDIDNGRDLNAQLDKYCKGTDRLLRALKTKYQDRPALLEKLNAYEEIEANDNPAIIFADEFPQYCQDLNEGEIFEGSNRYVCKYPGKTLTETYRRIRAITDDGQYMRESLSDSNLSFAIEDGKLNYQWLKPNLLKLVVEQGAQSTTYLFEENEGGTQLTIDVETGY